MKTGLNIDPSSYQDALAKSGFDYQLRYNPPASPSNKKKRSRAKYIVWFNPPYSKNVSSNVGAQILKLIKTCFPPSHPLAKIVNRNTVKLSYRCMPNMSQIISSHNSKVKCDQTQEPKSPLALQLQGGGGLQKCPVNGACQTVGVIYQATVTRNDDGSTETYTGLTSRRFKDRIYEHTSDMNNQKNKGTTLSNHVWKLKQQNKGFETKWKILSRGRSFNPSTRQCNLCLKEKYFIMFKPNRSEFFSTCRHKTKPLLHSPD